MPSPESRGAAERVEVIDPLQRLFRECAWERLEEAGLRGPGRR